MYNVIGRKNQHFMRKNSGKMHFIKMAILMGICIVTLFSLYSKSFASRSDSQLDGITVTGNNSVTYSLSPKFSSSQYTYAVSVPYSVSSVRLTYDEQDSSETETVTGPINSLSIGTNVIKIVVTSGNRNFSSTYTLNITRASASTNADLSDLTVSSGSLSPAFSGNTTSYTVNVPYSITTITVDATAADSNATVTGDGSKNLSTGNNTVSIVVTAESGTKKTYTITITRALASTNANLSGLTISSGTLNPVFSSNTTSYTVSVPFTTTTITVDATAADSNATVTGDGSKNLSVGNNTVSIVVTAESGTKKTYTIIITRASASTNANLSSLTISPGTLNPVFSSNTTSYTVSVPFSTTTITVDAIAADSNATVTGDGNKNLSVGNNTVSIVVTAESGTKKTYTITITRASASNNANLSSLTISPGTLNPVFSSNTTSYTVSVPFSTTTISVDATAADSKATVTGDGSKNLSVGSNTVSILVTAESGTKKTYTIIITRASASNNANLSSLAISSGTLNPVFSSNTTSYTATVDSAVSSVTVTAKAADDTATVTGTGNYILNVGTNTISVKVIAENGTTTKTYTINITRTAELLYSADVFTEAYQNDGTVNTTIKVIANGCKFITGTFSSGTHFTTSRVPAGLTMTVKSVSDTEAIIGFTNKATSNALSDSTTNTAITFTKDAFVGVSNASSISGSTKTFRIIFTNSPNLQYETSAFTESELNDGTIAGSKMVSLEGAKFRDKEFVYGSGKDYTTSNVPSGLTLSAIRVSDHWVRLELSGKAAAHAKANSINNMGISFNSSAFADNSASPVMNSSVSNLVVNFIDTKPLRILEVYPNKILSTDADETRAVYDALKSDSNYIVTSISLNKFISLRDDVNGNFDVIYFGKGSYNQNTTSTEKYGNDITSSSAVKVLDYINSNQLCIFHESVFFGNKVDGTATANPATAANTTKTPITYMYSKFNPTRSKPNVKVVTDTQMTSANIKNTISSYYSTCNKRPVLTVYDQPVSYKSIGQPWEDRRIECSFKVYDPDLSTDTTMTAIFYIDRNNDSLFNSAEKVEVHTVKNEEADSVTFDMPEGLTGVYFWKLEIIDSKGAKDEIVDVFRLKGDEIAVRVLQIEPSSSNAYLTSLFNTPVTGVGVTPGDTLGYRYGEYRMVVTEATVAEFNAGTTKNLRALNGNYDMIVLGFLDNYSQSLEFNVSAIDQLDSFIGTKQGVMFTHDSIHFSYNQNLTTAFRDDVGQTNAYTAGLVMFNYSGNKYYDGSLRSSQSTINSNYSLSDYQIDSPGSTTTQVRKVNSTAVTLYPYNLEGSMTINVAKTHYQWTKLDLEQEDVVPLFNLYTTTTSSTSDTINRVNKVNDDSMNNYYTYTKGNITYSGTGHSNGYPDQEVSLFVNTAMKAYAGANHAPSITVYSPTDGGKINCSATSFSLKFKVFDFDYDDTKVKYQVMMDPENDGSFKYVGNDGTLSDVDTLTTIDNGTIIEIPNVSKNFTTPGAFKLRIIAKDLGDATNTKDLTLNNTEDPLIDPEITFYNASGNPITQALAGETVKVRTTMKVSGYTEPEAVIKPTFNLTSSYKNNSDTIITSLATNAELNTVTFSTAAPTPGIISTEAAITADIGSASKTDINFTAEVAYAVNGLNGRENKSNAISVRNGQVRIHVLDDNLKAIRNAEIFDASGNFVGKSDVYGWVRLNRIIGSQSYSITAPSGYVYNGDMSLYKARYDVNGNPLQDAYGNLVKDLVSTGSGINVTFNDYVWEVEFKVKLSATFTFAYYQMKQDRKVEFLGYDNQDHNVKVQKNAPAKIAVKITIAPITGASVEELAINLRTEDKSGTTLTSSSALYASVMNTAIAIVDPPAELSGLTQLKQYNNTPPAATGNYAGASYYFVIDVPKADMQKIKIDSIYFKMNTTSEHTIPLSSIKMLNIVELTAPQLR